jgi:hypothetical protein
MVPSYWAGQGLASSVSGPNAHHLLGLHAADSLADRLSRFLCDTHKKACPATRQSASPFLASVKSLTPHEQRSQRDKRKPAVPAKDSNPGPKPGVTDFVSRARRGRFRPIGDNSTLLETREGYPGQHKLIHDKTSLSTPIHGYPRRNHLIQAGTRPSAAIRGRSTPARAHPRRFPAIHADSSLSTPIRGCPRRFELVHAD